MIDHSLVISLQKAGTHMISGLMHELGYFNVGAIFTNDEQPSWTEEEYHQITKIITTPDERFKNRTDPEFAKHSKDMCVAGLLYLWGLRLGTPYKNRIGFELLENINKITPENRLKAKSFEDLPKKVCLVKHELSLKDVDASFLRNWTAKGRPAVIFNYRDPRDMFISMINYLVRGKHSYWGAYHVYAQILKNLPDFNAQLTYALSDPCFPGAQEMKESMWMKFHPLVCSTSYEEIVGSSGGGCDKQQLDAVARILKHHESDLDPEVLTKKIYNPNASTFVSGQIEKWKNLFTKEHHELFNHNYGIIAQNLGYELQDS